MTTTLIPDRANALYEFIAVGWTIPPRFVLQVRMARSIFSRANRFTRCSGAMKQTPVIGEIQATQEYLGQPKHLVYLGRCGEKFFAIGLLCEGQGSTVAKVLAGKVQAEPPHGNGFRDQSRVGRELVRAAFLAVQIGMPLAGSRGIPELSAKKSADDWTRYDFQQRRQNRRGHSGHDDVFARNDS